MDNKIELLNLITDLKRAVRFMVNSPNKDCFWIQNISQNYPNLISLDPKIKDYLDFDILQNNSISSQEKAEILLMSANRLQHYLFK